MSVSHILGADISNSRSVVLSNNSHYIAQCILTISSVPTTKYTQILHIERCGPCQMIAPKFEEMANENPNAIFVKVDVDKMDTISQNAGVRAMPTFQFFKNGEKVDEMMGANVAGLKEKVSALI